VSTSTLSGLMGQPGFYRGNVSVNLYAFDPVILGHETETSGLLKLNFSLDGGNWQTVMATTSNLSITLPLIGQGNGGEGSHNLSFFSTDRAGNNEAVQTINFVIDKTPPEFNISFNPTTKDLNFKGLDNISTTANLSLLDQDTVITLTDEAGNTSQISLKDKSRKKSMKAEILSLSYNNLPVDINKVKLHFDWDVDKAGNLKSLNQEIRSKKNFNIQAEYKSNVNQTKLEGKDQSGKISRVLNGLVSLIVKINNGDIDWTY